MNEKARAAAAVLKQLTHMRKRADEIDGRIRNYRDEARRTSANLGDGSRKSTATSRVENYAAKAMDYESQMADALADVAEKCAVIQTTIEKMEREDYKRMLELRFLDGLEWNQIQGKMNISSSTSYRMYEEALTAFCIEYRKLGVHGS